MTDIELVHVSKSFDGRPVLADVSFLLPAGTVTVVLGPSGCGKTTLLRLLMGLSRPDAGEIRGMPARLSAVFQEERLCPEFSAWTNVRIVLSRTVNRQEIERQLTDVGLGDSLHRPVRLLSGGMQRRVSLVRALLCDSDLLVLDEPFKGLDQRTKARMVGYLLRQRRGRTLILVTHEPQDAAALHADQVIHLPQAPSRPRNS
jgi:NitT/TauT family transport system ATP-binding protein